MNGGAFKEAARSVLACGYSGPEGGSAPGIWWHLSWCNRIRWPQKTGINIGRNELSYHWMLLNCTNFMAFKGPKGEEVFFFPAPCGFTNVHHFLVFAFVFHFIFEKDATATSLFRVKPTCFQLVCFELPQIFYFCFFYLFIFLNKYINVFSSSSANSPAWEIIPAASLSATLMLLTEWGGSSSCTSLAYIQLRHNSIPTGWQLAVARESHYADCVFRLKKTTN